MTKAERARELFLEGCNCAQAVFLAFAEEKMDRDAALKIASGFGGGMAGMRNVCGAVNGMFMAYGLLCGPADPTDRAAKAKSYETLAACGRIRGAQRLTHLPSAAGPRPGFQTPAA